jgi:DUF4097 and DUF4098 domain-containing protein YvlB
MRNEHFETAGHVRLEIDNEAGTVDVTTSDAATTTIELSADPDAQELLDRATVECRPSGDGHVVRVKLPKQRLLLRRSERVRIVVVAPHGTDLSVSTASANVDATGLFGRVDSETASGDVTVDQGSDVRMRTASGDLSLGSADTADLRSVSGEVVVGRVTGRTRINGTSATVRLGEAGSQVTVETVSGAIEVDLARAGVNAKTVSGDVSLRCVANGDVVLSAVSGDAIVGIPPGRAIEVDAQSLSGRLQSDFDLDGAPAVAGAGVDPGGRVHVRSNSVSGNLRIVRAAAPPPDIQAPASTSPAPTSPAAPEADAAGAA